MSADVGTGLFQPAPGSGRPSEPAARSPQHADHFLPDSASRGSQPHTQPAPEAVVTAGPPSKKRKSGKGAEKIEGAGKAGEAGDGAEAGSSGQRRASSTLTAFTVQCALCQKWRKIPSLEEYEAIRAQISQQPFTCERARKWRPDSTCEDPTDLVQDGSLLWAMDRQDIPQTPAGWRRRIVVRGGSTSKFSDVYYHSPCGRSLRSMNDVEKFLLEHPQYMQSGVSTKQFSFSSPRPLQSQVNSRSVPKAAAPFAAVAIGDKKLVDRQPVQEGDSEAPLRPASVAGGVVPDAGAPSS